MQSNKYRSLWLVFIEFRAEQGKVFNDLLDHGEDETFELYDGAWANVLVKANSICDTVKIARKGLAKHGFKTIFIDKVENLASLVEHNEVNEDVIREADWLLDTEFVFKISDKIFPYTNETRE